MNEPKVNQKIHIIDSDETGTITKVYPPCAEHSGRFIAYIHAKNRSYYTEFWYSDIDKSVVLDKGNNS